MRRVMRSSLLAATACALALAPAAEATAKKPRKPSKAVIAKLLAKGYCGPETAANGNAIAKAKVDVRKVKVAKPRVGRSWEDGTPPNRKTYVFPVRASWTCDYRATPLANPGDFVDDRRFDGDYVFFRDEFGAWTQRTKGHEVTFSDGTD